MNAAGRRAVGLGLVLAFFLGLSLVATWPLARHGTQFVIGHDPRESTPPLNIWAMSVVQGNLLRQPLRLFDGNAFYPYRDSLAFSEHLFLPALLAWPWLLLTGNWALAYNAVTLFTLATAGLGMYLLARELTGHRVASLAAGALYAFHTWNVNELVRLQIVSNQYFPFVLFTLLRYFAHPAAGRAALVALAVAAQALSCMYWMLYLPWFAAAAVGFLQWRHRLPWRRLWPVLGALRLALSLAVPFAIPYLRTASALGFQRGLPNPLRLDRYFDVLSQNLLYGNVLGTARYGENAAHFLGFAAVVFGAIGLLTRNATEAGRRLRPLLAALVTGGFLLSLGPRIQWGETVLAPGPYLLLYHHVPGFRNVRYPERLSLFLVLGLAPLVAMGLTACAGRLRRAGTVATAVFILLEHLSVPQALANLPSGKAVPAVYRWLAERGDVRVVTDVPVGRFLMERRDALPMYFSAIHGKPSVLGYTGYFPPAYHFVRWRLFHFPAPESIAFLERFGVDTVVVDPAMVAALPRNRRLELHGPFPEGHVVAKLRHARPGVEFVLPDAPGAMELPRQGWQVEASAPSPAAAVDGDQGTAWQTTSPQVKDDYYLVRFPSVVSVSRVSLAVHPTGFPMHVKLVGQRSDGERTDLPFDAAAAYDHLFATLLQDPRHARLDIDIAPAALTSLRVRISRTDPFDMPWSLPELRMYGPPPPGSSAAEAP